MIFWHLQLVKIKLYNFVLKKKQKDQSKHFYLGMRSYPNYFKITEYQDDIFDYKKKFEEKKQFSKAINSKNFIFKKNLDEKKFIFLQEFYEICIKNNINLKIYFEPINKIQLMKQDYLILKTELEIIKKFLVIQMYLIFIILIILIKLISIINIIFVT